MKKFMLGLAALSMMAPSVATAGTAAQALSVKSAAVQPVRAAAKPGEAKAIPVLGVVLIVAVLGGIVWAVADGDSN